MLTLSLFPPRTRAQGTDGRKYVFLAKPKDDLRRDSRVMEFQSLMNMLLRKDAGAFRFALLSRCLGVGDGCEGWGWEMGGRGGEWSPVCENGDVAFGDNRDRFALPHPTPSRLCSLSFRCLFFALDARRRALQIKTYAVVPLNEECGLIQWVHNTKVRKVR